MMLKYVIGAVAGGLVGYFVLYRLIGCSSGSCPMTANPYLSTIIGIVMGLLVAGIVASPTGTGDAENKNQSFGAEYKRISAEEAKTRMDSGDEVIILDVRTEGEFNAGHIPGAILIPNETITDKMPDLLPDLDAEILIYCRSGNRSAQAARKLIQIGYTNVYDFGGINRWDYDIAKE
jgi:rhodanese-related sulfurtransferase/xanthosine utilization system XapX-like protein